MTNKTLCIYHKGCVDGFGSAWVVRKALGVENVDFHPGIYQDAPPDVTGRDVIMVDFSYKRPVLEDMAKKARSILILDHHASAAKDLTGFPEPLTSPLGSGVYTTFDMERSGAAITWDHFFGGSRYRLIDHIEDRDLWRFKLPNTREIQAAVYSYDFDFAVWDDLMMRCETEEGRDALIAEGAAIDRQHMKNVKRLVKTALRSMNIAGVSVPVANLPYMMASDGGHLMCEESEAPFSASYYDTEEHRIFSLRSLEEGTDVQTVATQYGGGGHKHAAGFRMPLGWEGE